MRISIIIPTYNEEEHIASLVRHLRQNGGERIADIHVIDGGSQDNTLEAARAAGATAVCSPKRGRAAQMNHGVRLATGDVLYFVHADAIPPASFAQDITIAIKDGYPIGCYRFRFRSDKLLLKINAYCTRFDRIMCRGGDQTLFVLRPLFEELSGYQDDHLLMEEYDFILRARKRGRFKIIPKDVLVSARKYEHNSYLRVNLANLTMFLMFFAGFSQIQMVNTYKRMIASPKI